MSEMYGVVHIILEYGDEVEMMELTGGEQNWIIGHKDNDHVLVDGMCQVNESGEC